MNKTEKLVYELAEPIISNLGCFIYDVEFVKEGADRYLRVFADTEEGLTIEECESISRLLSDALDEADPISESYYLEVSSPGVERKLKLPWHFEMYNGCEIDISLYKAVNGAKKLTGVLTDYTDDAVVVTIGEDVIPFDKKNIADVHLHFEF